MKNLELTIKSALRNAINRTLTQAQKHQRELIREELYLPNKRLKSLTLTKRASIHHLKAQLRSLDVRISLSSFPSRENKSGMSVRIGKSKRVQFKGAFNAYKLKDTQEKLILSSTPSPQNGFNAKPIKVKSRVRYKTKGGEKQKAYLRQAYIHRSKLFSLIALDKSKALQEFSLKVLEDELQKE